MYNATDSICSEKGIQFAEWKINDIASKVIKENIVKEVAEKLIERSTEKKWREEESIPVGAYIPAIITVLVSIGYLSCFTENGGDSLLYLLGYLWLH